MAIGGAPQQISDFGADVSRLQAGADGDRVIVWADQTGLPRPRLRRDDLPGQAGRTRPHLRQDVRAPLGHLGRAGHAFAHLRLPDRGRKADRRWRSPDRRPGRRHAVEAVRRRRGDCFLARRQDRLLRASRGGRIEPTSTNLDIFASPATAARRRSTSPTRTTAPTTFRPSRRTGGRSPISRWRGRATRPTARSCSFATSPPARRAR